MQIKYLEVKNFKSFKDIKIYFNKLNIIVGANASGKTNLIELLKFLHDIMYYGLNNAISMQGGIEYLRNVKIGKNHPLSIKIIVEKQIKDLGEKFNIELGKDISDILPITATIDFSLGFNGKNGEYFIEKDEVTLEFPLRPRKSSSRNNTKDVIKASIRIWNNNGNIGYNLDNIKIQSKDAPFVTKELFDFFDRVNEIPPNTLLIEHPMVSFYFYVFDLILSKELGFFDFNPKLSKSAVPISGKLELERNGSNLAIVLKKIIDNKESKDKLYYLLNDLLPFIKDINIAKIEDKSLLLKLKEEYAEDIFMPAFLISEGTIHITEIIIALYFDHHSIVVIEEPERNIHPYLMAKIVDMFEDACYNKQIIVTTHNPELVKYVDLENIFLVYRDKEGYSKVVKPRDLKTIQAYLEENISIDELFVDNLLEE